MKFTQKYDKQRLGKLFDQSSNLSLSADFTNHGCL